MLQWEALGQAVLFGLVWGGVYALIASGLNLIFGVMKILNIAHGELMMLAAYGVFWCFTLWGWNPFLALLVAAPAVMLLGLVIHKLVVEPIIRANPNPGAVEKATLVAFFGVLLVLQNTAVELFTGDFRSVRFLRQPITFLGLSIAPVRLVVLGVAVLVTALVFWWLHRTLTGKALRAISQDRATARLIGIPARRIEFIGFAVGSLLAGIGGSLLSLIFVISPSIGLMFTVKAFTIMVLGGLGSQAGTLAAALGLGVMESLASLYAGEIYKDVIGYLLLITVILVRFRNPELIRQ